MSAAEVRFFQKLLDSAETYLEFGCGGSTLMAVKTPGIRRIWSVESDAVWTQALLRHPVLAKAAVEGRLDLRHVDIGPTGKYGVPTDETTSRSWPSYYEQTFKTRGARHADLFLIDGRFRVACALNTLLHCKPGAKVVIHDFWNREHYHAVLPFARVLDRCHTMAVLGPKPKRLLVLPPKGMRSLLEQYRLVTA